MSETGNMTKKAAVRMELKKQAESTGGLDVRDRAEADQGGDDTANRLNRSQSKNHVSLDDLRKMCESSPTDIKGLRDRALLLYTFWTGSRRSESVVLRVSDITWKRDGADIAVRMSKTNQTGEEKTKPLPQLKDKKVCPVAALKA